MNKLLRVALNRFLLPQFVEEIDAEYKLSKRHFASRRANKGKFRGVVGLKLNIGSGTQLHDGWVNIDISDSLEVFCWDIRRPWPFDDGSVRYIFAEHVFEHLDYDGSANLFLSECFRVLEPGGIVRLIVPDAGRYLKLYAGDWSGFFPVRPLTPVEGGFKDQWIGQTYRTQMELINAVFRQSNEHKYAYDAETLLLKLRQFPFSTTLQQELGRSAAAELLLDTPERGRESLYVEAMK